MVKVKVKQSLYNPGGSQISGQSLHKGGKVVEPTREAPNRVWWKENFDV